MSDPKPAPIENPDAFTKYVEREEENPTDYDWTKNYKWDGETFVEEKEEDE